jgi:L-iditol 2-dehydrogenase
MKLLTCSRTGAVEAVDVPEPVAGPGEILVRMALCGVCGTDLMKVFDPDTPKPVQLGHEIVGRVAALGEGVTRFRVGQRVGVAHHAPDYGSHYARRGSPTQDPHFKKSNVSPGGFAEVVRVPADLVPHTVVPVPEHMPDERAVFMEPLACCLRALDRVTLREGDTVLIVGVGAIGLLFLPLLRDRSVTVLAADTRRERLAAATAWGAAEGFLAGADDVAKGAKAATDGRGADLVLLTATNAATIALALDSVRDGGVILPFGVKPGMMPPVDLWQLYRREVSITTSYSATPEGLARAMAILARDEYALEKTISHRLPITRAGEGFALLHDLKASKVVISG